MIKSLKALAVISLLYLYSCAPTKIQESKILLATWNNWYGGVPNEGGQQYNISLKANTDIKIDSVVIKEIAHEVYSKHRKADTLFVVVKTSDLLGKKAGAKSVVSGKIFFSHGETSGSIDIPQFDKISDLYMR